MEIEEPPAIAACSACSSPLGWMYSAKRKVWISVVRDPDDPDLYRIHRCAVFGQPNSWRHVQPQSPQTAQAGIERVRAALAKSSTDKKEPS